MNSTAPGKNDTFKFLPSVDELLRSETGRRLTSEGGAQRLTALARTVIDELRDVLKDRKGNELSKASVLMEAETRIAGIWAAELGSGLRRVINATGVIIHTNLGRAPLSDGAREALASVAGYCNIEYDLETGRRGTRGARVESMLRELTGAGDAIVVNNCAAAAFLVLSVFAAGREVVISRGELVEIGGDFRVPDVLSRSGAVLKEVGTTNRTRIADYEKAISETTAMILKVHPSNYRIVGFTAMPSINELAELAHRKDIILYEDAGSGVVSNLTSIGLGDEPVIKDTIAAGADIVTFSGDKLLGGPQSGIIVGRAELIETIRKDPLYRALRVDKLVYAALEATLDAHLRGAAFVEIPVLRMLSLSADDIADRSHQFAAAVTKPELNIEVIRGNSAVGGGSAPMVQPDTMLIALEHTSLSADQLESKLRKSDPPVISRIVDGRVVIDLRTVSKDEESDLTRILSAI